MKTNSKQSTKLELIVIAAVLFFKSLLVQPFYKKLFGFAETTEFFEGETLLAAGAIVLSVLVSIFLVKTASTVGESSIVLVILAVAEPMLIATLSSVFHVLAVIIAVICVFVCIKTENRILPAILTVAASAAISFIMPCSVFSFVLLTVIVLLITTPKNGVSTIISLAGVALSVAAANVCVQLSDAELRIYFKLYEVFDKFGGNECHPLVFYNLETLTSERLFSTMKSFVTASLPVIIVMIYIVVKVIGYKGKEKALFAKGLTVMAIILPYAALLFESVICMGNGFMTGFNLVPIMIVIAFASKGNKFVVKALDDIYAFAKAHPIVAVVAIIWLASYSAAFASDNKVFSLVTQFAM